MNNLTVVNEDINGLEVRCIVVEGARWWLLRDLAEGLGFSNPTGMANNSIQSVNKSKVPANIFEIRSSEVSVVNDLGLLELLCYSNSQRCIEVRNYVFKNFNELNMKC